MSKANRTKGKVYERSIVEYLRIYGYDAHRTSQQDKELDEAGVDILSNTKFHIQCKAVEHLNKSYHNIINGMPTDKIPVIFHKKNNQGTLVVMKLEDFANLNLYQDEH